MDFYYSISQKDEFVYATFSENICDKTLILGVYNQQNIITQNIVILHSIDFFLTPDFRFRLKDISFCSTTTTTTTKKNMTCPTQIRLHSPSCLYFFPLLSLPTDLVVAGTLYVNTANMTGNTLQVESTI